jgi:hypothetical protein
MTKTIPDSDFKTTPFFNSTLPLFTITHLRICYPPFNSPKHLAFIPDAAFNPNSTNDR